MTTARNRTVSALTPVPKNAIGHKIWVVIFLEHDDQIEPETLTDAWPMVFRSEKAAQKMNKEHPGTFIYESEVQQ